MPRKDMSFDEKVVTSSSTSELLSIKLDLNFKSHIEHISCKANNKIKAIFPVQSFLPLEQAKVSREAYMLSNFGFCPLLWMFYGKCSKNMIMKTHYRCLQAIYKTQTNMYHETSHKW